jgi:hypothetical protein
MPHQFILKINFKILVVVLNNTGKTLRGIGSDLASGNINVGGLMLEETHVIKVPNINGVAISEKYWLNNDSYAITNDALQKLMIQLL